jgi:hypothetical protein
MKHETTPRFTIKFHTKGWKLDSETLVSDQKAGNLTLKLEQVSSFGPKGWKLDSETSASFQIPANFRLLGETCLQNLLPGFRLS